MIVLLQAQLILSSSIVLPGIFFALSGSLVFIPPLSLQFLLPQLYLIYITVMITTKLRPSIIAPLIILIISRDFYFKVVCDIASPILFHFY